MDVDTTTQNGHAPAQDGCVFRLDDFLRIYAARFPNHVVQLGLQTVQAHTQPDGSVHMTCDDDATLDANEDAQHDDEDDDTTEPYDDDDDDKDDDLEWMRQNCNESWIISDDGEAVCGIAFHPDDSPVCSIPVSLL